MNTTSNILSREWFYEFTLPDGTVLPCRTPAHVRPIHQTRLAMLLDAIDRAAIKPHKGLRAIDIACHQGYFSTHLARAGFGEVVATDARSTHIEDTGLIASGLGLTQIRTHHSDLFDLNAESIGTFDLVLLFGLLYHVENPVGALRIARSLTRRACVIETQISPGMQGRIDWGSYEYSKPIMGTFAVIDETEELHGPEMSVTGICLCPSLDALQWILLKVGFKSVEVIMPPQDSYEQHKHGKRAVVLALV